MNPTAVAVAVEAPPVIMAPDVSLPVKNAAKETAEGILYGSVSFASSWRFHLCARSLM